MSKAITTDDGRRISLPEPSWSTGGPHQAHAVGTGEYVTGIYVSPRPNRPRIVIERYSLWQGPDGHQGARGTYYTLHEPGDPGYAAILALCEKHGVEIPPVLETAEPL